ncbi:MAG: terminase small subunit [Myxococcales bacterium]|nr:terminase small subunit [Myxococcales bacterium]
MARRDLTEKQRRFVEAYVGPARGNATEAARRAGYRGSTNTLRVVGQENLLKPALVEAIAAATAAARQAAILDRDQQQAFLSAVVLGRECLTQTDDGEVPPRAGDRIRACELLGRMQGHYIERVETRAVDAFAAQLAALERRLTPEVYEAVLDALAADAPP